MACLWVPSGALEPTPSSGGGATEVVTWGRGQTATWVGQRYLIHTLAEDGFKVGGGTGVSCDLCGLGAGDGREIPFLTVLAPEVGDVRTTMCGGPIEGSSLCNVTGMLSGVKRSWPSEEPSAPTFEPLVALVTTRVGVAFSLDFIFSECSCSSWEALLVTPRRAMSCDQDYFENCQMLTSNPTYNS